jgi:lytic murein transglycosylase
MPAFAGMTHRYFLRSIARVVLALVLAVAPCAAQSPAPAFQQWLQSLWPEAQALGVSRATFEAATRALEPDLTLPDLVIPGRPERPRGEQAEFVQTPADYLKETTLARHAAQGRKLLGEHRPTLAAIEQRFGVPGAVVLAVWGRETGYGIAKLPHNAIRALATQAYLGRRKEQFRQELLLALKMLQDGHVALANMRSSWAGAMGQPQLLPSGFYKHAVDFDGDGRRDIWGSVPDALATIAKQLADLGWQRGRRWAYEVRAPQGVDCTMAGPGTQLPMAEWIKRGYALAGGAPPARDLATPASLLIPEGSQGPAFLTLKNYYVLKDYNFSDLYVLFVGNLADRIAGGGAFATRWTRTAQLRTAEVEAMQRHLMAHHFYDDKIDGKAGMLTRAALGAYQKAHGLTVDCWPTPAVIDHMRAAPRGN